jgi:hypothetical protein
MPDFLQTDDVIGADVLVVPTDTALRSSIFFFSGIP